MITKEHFETLLAGLVYVSIGTAIAMTTNVSAQNTPQNTPQNKSVAPAGAPAAASTSCAPVETPDAMCTVPLKKGPETKICFGDHHPRCFELKAGHLYQSIQGGVAQDSTLTPEQQSNVKTSITSFTTWLEASLSKKPNKFNACADTVAIDSMSEHKVFCLTRLPKKDVQAKTKDLLATLEFPTKSARSSAL